MLMGSFRYVQCVVDFILWPASDQDRQNMLASRLRFPTTPAGAYAAFLLAKDGEDKLMLREALHTIVWTSSEHPASPSARMTIPQICQMLSMLYRPINPDESQISRQISGIDRGLISRLCGPLVSCRRGQHWELGHRTVYEFLQGLGPDSPDGLAYYRPRPEHYAH